MTDLVHPVTGLVLFSHKELASPDTGEVVLATGFAELLVRLRVSFGLPMVVTSCCRSKAYNETLPGAHPRSLHVYDHPHHPIDGTAAIDVTVNVGVRGVVLRRLVEVALEQGWSFGLAKSFIHLDRRDLAGLPPGAFGY